MNSKIWGELVPAVTITLDKGESIYTQSGGMSWMSGGIEMETNMKGGIMKGIGRIFSGESIFMATYTAAEPNQTITLSSAFPGEVHELTLENGKEYICQKSSFLCAEPTVELSAYVTKGLKKGLFGGEGFVMQRLSGTGTAFVELDGSIQQLELAAGESIKVDTGCVALFESTVEYNTETVRGFKNILFGGEGLFLTTLTGPGKVYLQTMDMSKFVSKILPYIPAQHSD